MNIKNIPSSEQPERNKTQELRKKLNGILTMAPIFDALIRDPGFKTEDAKKDPLKINTILEESTKEIQKQFSDTPKNDTDTGYQIRKALIRKAVAPLISEAWKADKQNCDPQKIANMFVSMTEQTEFLPEQAFTDLDWILNKSLSEAKATATSSAIFMHMQAIDPEQKKIGMLMLGKENTYLNAIKSTHDYLVSESLQKSEQLTNGLDEKQKQITFLSILKVTSQIYKQALISEFDNYVQKFKTMSIEDKKAFLADLPNHPNGIMIENTQAVMKSILPILYKNIDSSMDNQIQQENQINEKEVPTNSPGQ